MCPFLIARREVKMIPTTVLKSLEATSSDCVFFLCIWHHFEPLLIGDIFKLVLISPFHSSLSF